MKEGVREAKPPYIKNPSPSFPKGGGHRGRIQIIGKYQPNADKTGDYTV